MLRNALLASLLGFSLVASGCADVDVDGGAGGQPTPYDDEFPVSELDPLFEGAPSNDSLPDENKADAVYPKLYTELLAWQSPVKSQGSRGVCSIFSTAALMEHLYIREGTLSDPDFSEQFLQWSVKFEVGSFPRSSGSNAYYNLRAISQFGIPEEAAWPYEPRQWGVADDPECDGEDDQPTRCYTNGAPPESAMQATRYRLPRGRWLNTNSIKAHMTTKKTGVVVGLEFFYQSWNHRLSDLPINNGYWREGIVLYPNAEDKVKSREKPAGHSILLVGWDDDKEVQIVDKDGNLVVDENGDPVTEKGFYIFKNSWGTGSFGVNNPHGDGYGYISMRYVHEYGTAYVSDLPTVELPAEQCGNGLDDDRNGQADCDDAACASAPECSGGSAAYTFESTAPVDIPDDDPAGVTSTIQVDQSATIGSLKVDVDLTHTYRGDLRVVLRRGTQEVVLHDRAGSYEDDVKQTFTVTDFDGADMQGEWTLFVADHARLDTGTLNRWSLEILSE